MIYFLNDHKTGFVLSKKIADYINNSKLTEIEIRTFIKFWYDEYTENDKYVIFIRHPYEIITSGYNYHKKCKESWAIQNEKMFWWWEETHFTKESILKNREFLDNTNFSKEKPYQSILNELSLIEGLKYEMTHVGKMTIDGIYNYPHYNKPNVITIKMEDLFDDYNNVIKNMLNFINIENPKLLNELSIFDTNKMDKSLVETDDHITNKNRDKFVYKKLWTNELYELAEEIFPKDLLSKFNYEK